MKNTWERLKCVLSSCSFQTELLWFKQSDGTGLIRLQREWEWERARFDVWGCKRGSQQARDELSSCWQSGVCRRTDGCWISSPHLTTETLSLTPAANVPCVHKQHYNSTSAEHCLWKDQKRETTAMIDHEKCDLISPLSIIDFKQ